jgi:hypothetical protein
MKKITGLDKLITLIEPSRVEKDDFGLAFGGLLNNLKDRLIWYFINLSVVAAQNIPGPFSMCFFLNGLTASNGGAIHRQGQ